MAKNVITVAAIDTNEQIATFSSSGPLYDGRMAPQISALGANGTSEAAAIVSGSVALLQQLFKDSHAQQLPDASLIKSILYATTDDIGARGIDECYVGEMSLRIGPTGKREKTSIAQDYET